uniref:Uncharacterized protein n=1 Tax=Oryza glaberrima TaxID=4538 RepID=I1PCG4_ORYGL
WRGYDAKTAVMTVLPLPPSLSRLPPATDLVMAALAAATVVVAEDGSGSGGYLLQCGVLIWDVNFVGILDFDLGLQLSDFVIHAAFQPECLKPILSYKGMGWLISV